MEQLRAADAAVHQIVSVARESLETAARMLATSHGQAPTPARAAHLDAVREAIAALGRLLRDRPHP